ncbi:MAG: right-handed parallel beta-helix repeat-containing protein, partial [Planctomycetota bacterium]
MRRTSIRLLTSCYGALLAMLSFGPAPATAATELYVAVGGNDAWSGNLAEPNAEKTDGPFASLGKARDAIRALKNNGGLPEGGVTVLVRGGLYELPETFQLAAVDSGSKTAPVVYRAYDGEKPVLTGTRRITGFVPHRGRILKADVAARGLKDRYFRQLFFAGKRQVLARYPNFDPANPYAGGFAYVDGPLPTRYSMYKDQPDDSAETFHYRAKDARAWARPELGEVSIFPRYNWMNDIVPIASVDPETRLIRLARKVRTSGTAAIRPYDRYCVRNLLEELDAPGEWFLDKQTWTLYFWPPEPIEEGEVRAPALENLVQIGRNAAWITIRGFTMEGCDGSAVSATGANDCLIAGNTVHATGGRLGPAGISISHGRRCGVVGNDIFDVCNTGISLSGGDTDTLAPGEHYAENNYIHHVGLLNGHGLGISLRGVALRVAHNLIHDITRCGVFGGGPDCLIEYNHIRHVNLVTEDTGGRYGG